MKCHVFVFSHGIKCTFPHHKTSNPLRRQFFDCFFVSLNIVFKFTCPKTCITLWYICIFAAGMSVPVAAMNENGCAVFCQPDIWMPKYLRAVLSISVSFGKKKFPQIYFRLGISPFDSCHISAAFFRCLYISHCLTPQDPQPEQMRYRHRWYLLIHPWLFHILRSQAHMTMRQPRAIPYLLLLSCEVFPCRCFL